MKMNHICACKIGICIIQKDYRKLAEVIDLAEENNHILFTDFGYFELINHYKKTGNRELKEKYEKLYEKWKKNKNTINI